MLIRFVRFGVEEPNGSGGLGRPTDAVGDVRSDRYVYQFRTVCHPAGYVGHSASLDAGDGRPVGARRRQSQISPEFD